MLITRVSFLIRFTTEQQNADLVYYSVSVPSWFIHIMLGVSILTGKRRALSEYRHVYIQINGQGEPKGWSICSLYVSVLPRSSPYICVFSCFGVFFPPFPLFYIYAAIVAQGQFICLVLVFARSPAFTLLRIPLLRRRKRSSSRDKGKL